jgi:hypothetical protein
LVKLFVSEKGVGAHLLLILVENVLRHLFHITTPISHHSYSGFNALPGLYFWLRMIKYMHLWGAMAYT